MHLSLLMDWAELLVRWTHVIAGIAWIGSSFYFIALDASLQPHPRLDKRVKQMEEFLPVCGNCRKVRQDPAFWQEVEGWLHERKKAEVGLGVCPDCLERVLAARRQLPEA